MGHSVTKKELQEFFVKYERLVTLSGSYDVGLVTYHNSYVVRTESFDSYMTRSYSNTDDLREVVGEIREVIKEDLWVICNERQSDRGDMGV